MNHNYAKSLLNKDLESLTYSDIEDYFTTERTESDNLEFKSYPDKGGNFDQLFNDIKKAICSMLNSNGGIVIWGAPKGEKGHGKEKVFRGELSPLNIRIEKDDMINRISDNIHPLPGRINVKIIENNSKYVSVFEVQTSMYRPHQFEGTYWMRLDGQKRIAPHYFVEALIKQVRYPNLEGYIKFLVAKDYGPFIQLSIDIILLNFSDFQNEENLYFRFFSEKGYIEGETDTRISTNLLNNLRTLTQENFRPIFPSGSPVSYTVVLKYSKQFKSDLMVLAFGGKHSPMKFSEYRLNLEKIQLDQIQKFEDIVFEFSENQLNSQKKEEMKLTKRDILRTILGR